MQLVQFGDPILKNACLASQYFQYIDWNDLQGAMVINIIFNASFVLFCRTHRVFM